MIPEGYVPVYHVADGYTFWSGVAKNACGGVFCYTKVKWWETPDAQITADGVLTTDLKPVKDGDTMKCGTCHKTIGIPIGDFVSPIEPK